MKLATKAVRKNTRRVAPKRKRLKAVPRRPSPAGLEDTVAADLMTEKPITVDATSTVGEALDILANMSIRHLPVVDDEGILIGILSDRDVFTGTRSDDFAARSVSTVMNTNVVACNPDSGVGDIIDLLLDNRIGAVPVTEPDDGILVGIVSYVDILRAARRELG